MFAHDNHLSGISLTTNL